jgi:glucose/mannose-6-phosphate isomerase
MCNLDDPKEISSIDKSNMLQVLEETPLHYEKAWEIGDRVEVKLDPAYVEKLLFLGMGGSAVGGSLLKDWGFNLFKIPVEVMRDYLLPKYVDKHTLTFGVSYSGKTEETLTAFSEALKRGCPAVGLSSGGILEKICVERCAPHLKIPSGFQPRVALPYLSLPIFRILDKLGLINGLEDEVSDAIETLKHISNKLKSSVPSNKNQAKYIAKEIVGTLPCIYGFREFTTAAYRFKAQLNENSKTLAIYAILPELNHNEIMGWEGVSSDFSEKLSVILIRDSDESPEIKTRYEITKELIGKKTGKIYEIYAEGHSKLAKILSTIYLCDYISFYLAVLQGIDPTPINNIAILKSQLQEKVKT